MWLPHWIRDEFGKRVLKEIPERVTVEELSERIDQISVVVPYFQQAFQVVLFSKTNPMNYPQTRDALKEADDTFIENGSYEGLTEGQKAQLLISEVS